MTGGVPELGVLDYVMMSQFAYFPAEDTAVINAQLKEYFGVHGPLQLVSMKDSARGRFIAFEVPWANALVVAARGTATWRDLLANLNMYTEVSSASLSSPLRPMFHPPARSAPTINELYEDPVIPVLANHDAHGAHELANCC